ncbi:IclR family transcriptional regulator [Lampropedia aestuarii]|uniref:IclR family transcriptional regulator n=1 Tax=Lampropedia aestuarii TaxID=2562762 RepID=A0A4S5BTA2_9BURK|nr:IclR family transcriptional regulator [Lampropedia aestuarii]MDH5855765.1 IclR family transcriptional regulator [Lampropedia aestuarii]THJ36087.1 IclR family transcriptional regulator [Lampropedia aestuarii]
MQKLEIETDDPATEKGRRGIQSIEAGGQLLLALAEQGHPMPLRELAKAADMAPGKAHPYLVSFGKLGLVTQEASNGHYWLGPTAMQLGLVTLRMLNPVREATSYAEALARETGHSVALAVWGNQGPTIVFQFDAIYPLHTNIRTGTVMSLAGTATGRLFAAYLPAKLIEESLLEDERRLGPDIATAIDREELQSLVNEIRKHGLSRTINNPTPGVSSFAAPVFDYSGNIVLGITLMGRTRSFDTDWDGKEAKAIKSFSLEVSRRLGHQSK